MVADLISSISQNQIASGLIGAGIAGGAMVALRSLPLRVMKLAMHWATVEIEASNDQEAYYHLALMLAHRLGDRARTLSVVRGFDLGGTPYDTEEGRAIHLIAGIGAHLIWDGWNPILVRRTRADQAVGFSNKPRESISMTMPFWMRSRIADLLSEAAYAAKPSPDSLDAFISDRNGQWQRVGSVRKRPMSTIVLAPETEGSIVSTVRRFLASEGWYRSASIPYRLGMLFQGVPGTGKSSAALGVASEFGLPVYMMNLADLMSDGALFSLFTALPGRCVVLLEDIDAATSSARKRTIGNQISAEDDGGHVTLTGLLNALDGAIAAQGRIVVMSTNHPERLDPALLRPGRCDVRVMFELPDEEQVRRMHRLFFGERPKARVSAFVAASVGKSHAEIQEDLLRLKFDGASVAPEMQIQDIAA